MVERIETLRPSSPVQCRPRLGAKSTLRLFCAVFLFSILIFSVPPSRTYILASAGRILIVDQSAGQTDVIVVAIDADGAGTLEAADLVRQGVSKRVAVFNDPPTSVDREFLRRGLPYEDRAATSIRQLHSLGIGSVEQIPRTTTGSEQEGYILPGWCKEHGYHSVVLITSSDHSRRLSRILRRSPHSHDINVIVQSSPYSEFEPDAWWRSREGIRTWIFEFEKLVLDVARHPFA